MKTIYFIRHGESRGYTDKFEQAPETPLSEDGLKQSSQIAERIKNINFDLLITSPLKRTLQTAELISEKSGKGFEENDLFVERKRPSRQYNLQSDGELRNEIEDEYQKAFLNNEKYEDAESFEEVKKRVIKALKFLEESKEEKIVVVSHGTFLRYFAGLILLGEDNFNLENAYRITKILKKTNTGVSVFKKEKRWRIYSWNDFSHFDKS
jgi:broad specificity phosphatase PhoE